MDYIGHLLRDEALTNKVITFGSILFTGLWIVDRSDVTWVLSTIFTLLGIINFIVQIRKNTKKETNGKDNRIP